MNTAVLINKNKKSNYPYVFILLFCLGTIQFFNLLLIPTPILFYIYYALFLYSIAYTVISYKESYNNSFTLPIFLILLAQLIAIFTCSFSWHQSLPNSLLATSFNMSYILFFVLVIYKLSIVDIEKIIILCGSLYIVIYLASFVIYPRTFINWGVTYGDERGFQRIIVNGYGFLFLFSFYSLKNYITTHKKLWLLVYLVTCVLIIMTLTRTLIILSFLFSFLYIIRGKKMLTITLYLGIVVILLYIVSQLNFYKMLAAETKSQASYIKEDVRSQATDYYLNNFSTNNIAKVFGNGDAYKDTEYLQYMQYLENSFGYYEADIGYVGFYVKYGIIAILGYLIFIYRTLKVPVSEEYQYCKYFLYFIFAISVVIDAPFNKNFIPAIVLATYILSSETTPKKPVSEEDSTVSFT